MKSLSIIYASTSGNTEYVVDVLAKKFSDYDLVVKRVEEANADDLVSADVLLLASGTWNLGGSEGQLNPHMAAFLGKGVKDIDLAQKPCVLISLGDNRYRYTARATEHLSVFVNSHNGKMAMPPLVVINDPYGQEEKIEKWGEKLLTFLQS